MATPMHESKTGTITLHLEGMACGCEGTLVERKLKALAGVLDTALDPVTHQLTVSFAPGVVTVQEIVRSIAGTGMHASLEKGGRQASTWWRERQQLALYGCAALILLAFGASLLGAAPRVRDALYILAALAGVFYPARKALIALRNLTPTIHLLMLIGCAGAMILRMWGESAVLVLVYSLGDVLESYAVDKARGAIRSLMELMPRQALVHTADGEVVLPIEQVQVGAVVIVRPGEQIPVDGRVIRGSSYVNQAAVTGEPLPVLREAGGDVFAGTINQNGSLEVRVEKPVSEAMLSRIIHSVEEAQAKKTSLQRFSDAFGVYYTPCMFILGVLVAVVPPLFMGAEWLPFIYRGLVVFVVSCSCGLALSVPVAVVAAMANAARKGVIFKGGAYLEAMDRVRAVAFDKTGTLTIGRPEVTDIQAFGPAGEQEVLDLAGAIEARSGHPLAAAILRKAKEREGFAEQAVENFHEAPGLGVTATIGGRSCRVGSPRSHREHGIPIGSHEAAIAQFENEGKTVVLVSAEDQVIGLLAVSDRARPGASETLVRLKRAGIHTVMLTGDNERSARSVARELGVDECFAQLLPTDKVSVIRQLRERYGSIAMVGDGINDAPAMAVADVGIAMGAAGTDIAVEAGDVVLMADDLARIGLVRDLSSRTIATIRQNILISLANVAFMVAMALLGYLGLVTGLLLNELSALFVIATALRLLQWKSAALDAPTLHPATAGSATEPRPAAPVRLATARVPRLDPVPCCPSTPGEPSPVLRADVEDTESRTASATFQIHGVCSCESHVVERRVRALAGAKAFTMNPITNRMTVVYDPAVLPVRAIQAAAEAVGATAMLLDAPGTPGSRLPERAACCQEQA